jgi:hypothetical protein
MRLFARQRPPEAGTGYTGPPAAAMRGRAAEIADAGAVPWEVLWEALTLDLRDQRGDDLSRALGLELIDWRDPSADFGGSRMVGVRHGRQVEIRMGHMNLRGGPDGVVARRPISMRGQQAGWAYDLWLCERLASALGVPLPFADLDDAETPYAMG